METSNTVSTNISACPLNCWDTCSFQVKIKDKKIEKVSGNKEHPITKGKICNRGVMLVNKTNDPNRVQFPLKKIKGKWEIISWEQALLEIAFKMEQAKDSHGPTSILHSHDYANNGLLKSVDERFFRAFGGYTKVEGSLCWGAGIEAQIRDFGNSASHSPADILNSRNVVIWGRNVSRTNIHLYKYLLEVKKKGTQIIVIDPIKNKTAKIADSFIPLRPGSDGYLAAAIMKVILDKKWENQSFIENHSIGFETLYEELNKYEIDDILAKTGVERKIVEELAKIYVEGPTSTYLGLGMQRYKNGGNTIRLIDALAAISGNIGIPGGGVNYGNLPVGQSFDVSELALRDRQAEIRNFTRMNQGSKILHVTDPPIKVAFVSRSNPLTQLPDTNVAKKAFGRVETVVVMDHYMTDTAQLANYLLPTTTVFEEEDIYYASMYHSYANYGPKLVEPPGEAKSDLWIWTELAKLLGFGEDFRYTIEEWFLLGTKRLRDKGFDLDKLKEIGFLKLPVEDIPWRNYLFQTPSEKYEFYSNKAEGEGEEPTIFVEHPNEETMKSKREKRYPYRLLSLHPLQSNHSQHYPLLNKSTCNKVNVSENIAKRYDLKNGDKVTVKNDLGSLVGIVHIDSGIYDDTINIDEGQWDKFGGSVNVLTPSGQSDMGKGSIQYECFVSIEKKDGRGKLE
ncbi:molybdopterin-dependent oxidoreductase [Evansella sp. AB-rgal1]|uniref:molybdopterin-dependent oxidoreductase n=1 Tax=Evansella sp. AB-rgal1 TaxID=3242696 RepID=UPI00359E9620